MQDEDYMKNLKLWDREEKIMRLWDMTEKDDKISRTSCILSILSFFKGIFATQDNTFQM